MPKTTPFAEYEALIVALHHWHIKNDGRVSVADAAFHQMISRLEELEEDFLTEDEVRYGDRISSYLQGFRDGKSDDRTLINAAKTGAGEEDESSVGYAKLQAINHELYENGFDDYSTEVEQIEAKLESAKLHLSAAQSHAADIFEGYLTGFQHARDGRQADTSIL